MDPSLWHSAYPSSRKRPLDTIQEAGPSQNTTFGASATAFTSTPPSTSQAASNHGKSLRERFAESKWAKGSTQLNDISQQSLRYNDGSASRIPASKVEYRSMESVFAQPHMSMFGTGISDLNHAPSDHWFSKLRADWLQPKREEPKKKKKKKVVPTISQPPPPQSPDLPSPTQTISLLPSSAVDTPPALSPTATQYSQDDLVGYEIGTDDDTTLPPSSPMDIDAMRKMVAAFEIHTVVDDATQEMQIAVPEGLSQDHERETMIPIIITDVDAEAPSAVETSASSAFAPNSQLGDIAPVLHDAMIKPVASFPELEETLHLFAQIQQHFEPEPASIIPEPSASLNATTLLMSRIPDTPDYFATPHQPAVIDTNGFLPSVNLPHAYPPNAAPEDVSLPTSISIQATAESTSTKVTPNKSINRKARPAQQKKGKPKVLKEGQRNLKNNGIHQCPIPGCTETSSRDYDLKTRHMRAAHPEQAIKLGLFKPKKARVQVEGASKLDLNRNMMSVDADEEGMSEPNFRCPSCFRPYSRRDALIRHAESTINPERKNKPSCNLTVEEVRSLRKKFKTK